MIGYVSGNNAFDKYTASMHYYVRNSNGTCGNPNHRSTCIIWSHKMGMTLYPFIMVIQFCAIIRFMTMLINFQEGIIFLSMLIPI